MKYRVFDELNSSLKFAEEIEAFDEIEAAETYAKNPTEKNAWAAEAAEAAARAAAWAAARAAVGAAAGAAAGEELKPTVVSLQVSAFSLLERMIAA